MSPYSYDPCPGEWTKVEHYLGSTYQVIDYCFTLIDGECIPKGAIQFQGTLPECDAWVNLRNKGLL